MPDMRDRRRWSLACEAMNGIDVDEERESLSPTSGRTGGSFENLAT